MEGLTPFADVGVELVDDVAPFERRKLWLLNGPHSAVAYAGLLAGHTTIAGAVKDPRIARFVRDIVKDTLEVARSFPPRCSRRRSPPRRCGDSPTLRSATPCAQVGADGSSKLPQRLLPVVAARAARSLGTSTFALVAAIWLAAAGGVDVPGVRLPPWPIRMGSRLRSAAAQADGLQALSRVALGDNLFAGEVAGMLRPIDEGRALAPGGRAVTATLGGPGHASRPDGWCARSCGTRWPGWTWPAARCAS